MKKAGRKSLGKTPRKTISISVDLDVLDRMKRAAKAEKISVSELINRQFPAGVSAVFGAANAEDATGIFVKNITFSVNADKTEIKSGRGYSAGIVVCKPTGLTIPGATGKKTISLAGSTKKKS